MQRREIIVDDNPPRSSIQLITTQSYLTVSFSPSSNSLGSLDSIHFLRTKEKGQTKLHNPPQCQLPYPRWNIDS